MAYKPPFEQTTEISNLCLEIAELVGMLHPNSELSTSPTLHRKLRIPSEVFGLFMLKSSMTRCFPLHIQMGKRIYEGNKRSLSLLKTRRGRYPNWQKCSAVPNAPPSASWQDRAKTACLSARTVHAAAGGSSKKLSGAGRQGGHPKPSEVE